MLNLKMLLDVRFQYITELQRILGEQDDKKKRKTKREKIRKRRTKEKKLKI